VDAKFKLDQVQTQVSDSRMTKPRRLRTSADCGQNSHVGDPEQAVAVAARAQDAFGRVDQDLATWRHNRRERLWHS
jgi:hypothetical protein